MAHNTETSATADRINQFAENWQHPLGAPLVVFVKAIDKKAKSAMAGSFFHDDENSDKSDGDTASRALNESGADGPPEGVPAVDLTGRLSGVGKPAKGKLKGVKQSVKLPAQVAFSGGMGLGGLFDETLHPRAGAGMTAMNPETGQIIVGGQFAPKPKDAGDDNKPKFNRSAISDTDDGVEAGPVPSLKDKRKARKRGSDGAGTVYGSGSLFDAEWGGSSGSAEQRDAGDNSVALGGGGAGPVSQLHDELGDQLGDGIDAGPVVGDDAINVAAQDIEIPEVPEEELQHAPEEEVDDSVHTVSFTNVKTGTDYRITDADAIGKASFKKKFWNNVEAIRLLKTIESEGRLATPDEQARLVQYTGWGWAQKIIGFDAFYDRAHEWHEEHMVLRNLIGDEKTFRKLQDSVVNAHYTAPEVINAMWDAVRRLGFKGGRVLEPACGAGHFFGLMPSDLAAASRFAAVEIDPTTSGIAAQLYQSANIQRTGLETSKLPDNHFDLAISNVPFARFGVSDDAYNRPGKQFLQARLHNYFFAKSLEKIRPGGVIAFVTSTGTMDSPTARNVREHLSKSADLLGAVRLPDNAFAGNAGTAVTTDIIFLRKRLPGEAPAGHDWADTVDSGLTNENGKNLQLNEYYERHPEMLLGSLKISEMYGAGQKSSGLALSPFADAGPLGEQIANALGALPHNVMAALAGTPATTENAQTKRAFIPPPGDTKLGGYADIDGELMVREPEGMVPAWQVTDENGNVVLGEDGQPLRGMSANVETRIRGMLGLRDKLRDLHRTMLDEGASDESIAAKQADLSAAYDAFIKSKVGKSGNMGFIHSTANLRAMASDPDYSYLCGLEKYDPDTKIATKGDVFTKRTLYADTTITNVATPQAAMAASLSTHGRIDWDHMHKLCGVPIEAMKAHLVEAGVAYNDPNGYWTESTQYLSGDVKEKLRQAEQAAKLNPTVYGPNVKALQEVQPVDIDPEDISIKLGAGWVPTDVVQDFIHHILEIPAYRQSSHGTSVNYLPQSAQWIVKPPHNFFRETARATDEFGTSDKDAFELISCILNKKRPTVTYPDPHDKKRRLVDGPATEAAEEKLTAIEEAFHDWALSDDDRSTRLAKIYNDTFNCFNHREYDGSHLELPGMSDHGKKNINSHVRAAIWRQMQSPNTLLAHAVGAGKTWEGAGACMEMRRTGLAKKPMITVPNHLVSQWAKEFMDLYPGANVLMATAKDFKPENRRKFLAKAALGDWDAIVISHSSFGKIPVSEARTQKYFDEQMGQYDQMIHEVMMDKQSGGAKSPTFKALTAQRKALEKKLNDRIGKLRRNADVGGLSFEDLGVDYLHVDEAHLFKNLGFATKMTRVKGLSQSDSDRAFDMLMKTTHIQDTNGGRGVTFLTGTPISNSIAEMYTMQRYLQPKDLERRGLSHFDAWADNFATTSRDVEATPTGDLKPTVRLSKFVNLPELSGQFRQFTDVITDEELKGRMIAQGTKLPEHKIVTVECPMSDFQQEYVKHLAERAGNLKNGVDPRDDNMLKITSEGRKNSLDPRLLDPSLPDHPDSKINKACDNLIQEYADSHAIKGTQIVFMDLGTPKKKKSPKAAKGKKASAAEELGDGGDVADEPDTTDEGEAGVEDIGSISEEEERHMEESLYSDIKRKLVARGIPENEIAFIHDANTDARRLSLFQDVKAGRVRILLGSTEKMGTGMNVQDRMTAIHHMDCPWRPSDFIQRNGRVIRKGNMNDEVRDYRYIGKGSDNVVSFDGFTYQLIKSKQQTIDQVMKGDNALRTSDDTGDNVMTASQMIAIATGNPHLLEMAKVEQDLRRYTGLRIQHEKTSRNNRVRMRALPGEITELKRKGAQINAAVAFRDAHKPAEGKVDVSVGGQPFEKHMDGIKALLEAAKDVPVGQHKVVGTYNGFQVAIYKDPEAPANSVWIPAPEAKPDESKKLAFGTHNADGTEIGSAQPTGHWESTPHPGYFVIAADALNGALGGEWRGRGQLRDTPAAMAGALRHAVGDKLSGDEAVNRISTGAAEKDLEHYQRTESEFPHEETYQALKKRQAELFKELSPKEEVKGIYEEGTSADGNDATLEKGISRVNGQWSGPTPDSLGSEPSGRKVNLMDHVAGSVKGALSGVPRLNRAVNAFGGTIEHSTVSGNDKPGFANATNTHQITAPDPAKASNMLRAHLAGHGFNFENPHPAAEGGSISGTAPNGAKHVFHFQQGPGYHPEGAQNPPAPKSGVPSHVAFMGKPADEETPAVPKINFTKPGAVSHPDTFAAQYAKQEKLNIPRGNLSLDEHKKLTEYTHRATSSPAPEKEFTSEERNHFASLIQKRGEVGAPGPAINPGTPKGGHVGHVGFTGRAPDSAAAPPPTESASPAKAPLRKPRATKTTPSAADTPPKLRTSAAAPASPAAAAAKTPTAKPAASKPAAAKSSPSSSAGPDIDTMAKRGNLTVHGHEEKDVDGKREHHYLMSHSNPSRASDSLYKKMEAGGMKMSPLTFDKQTVDGRIKHVYKFSGVDRRGNSHHFHIIRPRGESSGSVKKTPGVKTPAVPRTARQLLNAGKR